MDDLDKIYRETPPDQIPWNSTEPPKMLAELVNNRTILPCKALDLGCGLGNYAIWMAQQGFEVTGIDISPTAIEMATQRSAGQSVKVNFMSADLTGDIHLPGTFDFIYDWEVLHHVFPEKRDNYAANVSRLLNPGGKYLSVCFSEGDTLFEGTGKYRTTTIGTHLYFSSEEEMNALFSRYFRIISLQTVIISGRRGEHVCIAGLMEKEKK